MRKYVLVVVLTPFLVQPVAPTKEPPPAPGLEGDPLDLQVFCCDLSSPLTDVLTRDVDQGVEFPDLADEDNPGGLNVVDVSIDVTDSTLVWDFSNTSEASFAAGDFNGYVFTDSSMRQRGFARVTIDQADTSLPIDDSRITVTQDRIEVNVQGLPFDTSTTLVLEVHFGLRFFIS